MPSMSSSQYSKRCGVERPASIAFIKHTSTMPCKFAVRGGNQGPHPHPILLLNNPRITSYLYVHYSRMKKAAPGRPSGGWRMKKRARMLTAGPFVARCGLDKEDGMCEAVRTATEAPPMPHLHQI